MVWHIWVYKSSEEKILVILVLKDDEFIYNCKKALMALPEPDRNLLIRYAEEGTYAAVAKRYHCSTPTVKYKIDEIRKKIFGYDS